MVVQISAMRALYEICTDLKMASDEQRGMIVEKLPSFLNFITDIATHAKGSVLIDVLSTIAAVAAVRLHLFYRKIFDMMKISFFNFYSLIKISRQTITRK